MYNLTAWSIKPKILQVMLDRDAESHLTAAMEISDAYWQEECHGVPRTWPAKTTLHAAVAEKHEEHLIALCTVHSRGLVDR